MAPRAQVVTQWVKEDGGDRVEPPAGRCCERRRFCLGTASGTEVCLPILSSVVLLGLRKLTQWNGDILIWQLIFPPSIINQVQDPSISLYLTVHPPAALILSGPLRARRLPPGPALLLGHVTRGALKPRMWLPKQRGFRDGGFVGRNTKSGA